MTSRERHIVGDNRLGETLEGERADLFSRDASSQRHIDELTEQDLAVLRFGTETGGDIADRADRRVT